MHAYGSHQRAGFKDGVLAWLAAIYPVKQPMLALKGTSGAVSWQRAWWMGKRVLAKGSKTRIGLPSVLCPVP
jgi:hypothetical protein